MSNRHGITGQAAGEVKFNFACWRGAHDEYAVNVETFVFNYLLTRGGDDIIK